jgi:translation initiation factor IF-3
VIDADGDQVGVISRQEALDRAAEAGLDLVEVSPNANPPVARIIDWGKYVYQKEKAKKKQRSQDLKQIRMGLKIGDHDLDIKMKKVKQWLEEDHKVRISAVFKGREMAHREIGHQLLDRVFKTIEDSAVIENQPQMSGRFLTMQVRKK